MDEVAVEIVVHIIGVGPLLYELPVQQEGTFFLEYPSWTRDGRRVSFSIHKKAGNIYVIER